MTGLAWAVPLLPLLAFVVQLLLRTKGTKKLVSFIGVGLTFLSFVFAVYLIAQSFIWNHNIPTWQINWLHIGSKVVTVGASFAPLQVLMLFIVSFVSCLVQIYSIGYMKADERSNTFFAYLSLFTFSMLGLVIAPNFLELYFFWELVGVCSFLLVGFYFYKESAKQAAKKAFIVTRIGDVGLFIAICLLFWKVGSFDFSIIQEAVKTNQISAGMITLIAILIFAGAAGKSGQFPLHTWLPDAMEGPTPVSALIHAATMVAAGVFLVAETFWLFEASSTALTVVSYIGAFTALFAALIALTQTDIKRVLAYSTVSQLGYMMLGLGSLGLTAGLFHLFTHAFFKALLFLVVGAVIVAFSNEQDIRKMGGLGKEQKWLGITFLIGGLSISGIPPFSGFFSKDEIFAAVYQSGKYDLFAAALLTAFCTAFYIFRLYFLVFTGRGAVGQTKTFSWYYQVPIWVLAVFPVISGFVQFPKPILGQWLKSSESGTLWWIALLAAFVALLGIFLAYAVYQKQWISASSLMKYSGFGYRLSYRKFYVDECYQALFVWSLKGLGWVLMGWDRFIIGGIARFIKSLPYELGTIGSYVQNGQVQRYLLISVFGFLLLLLTITAGRLIF
ncbi:NADH-quinone oxidoreductase subunit L [Shimazuella sp. AN120528]|uniref:NADH-quinone oxidoreductase subunit L n=1 Tax=Shimazuella soli TaxID=1892854 RepID=UPI001F0F5B1B|nr:NADH-quinone oxidoreductase subunit L [Shimazuella soli]MCH5585254.1 NADH-quinone oxidoreductase subunit L [Shimazuella soli]